MKIAPITTSFIPRNNNIKFSGLYDDSDEKFEKVKSDINSGAMLLGSLFLMTMAGAGALLYDTKDAKSEKFRKEIENIYQSNNIQKDTFTVKDMTYDDKPDLILYKNDGSKVVIDIANQEILEKTKDLTPVK